MNTIHDARRTTANTCSVNNNHAAWPRSSYDITQDRVHAHTKTKKTRCHHRTSRPAARRSRPDRQDCYNIAPSPVVTKVFDAGCLNNYNSPLRPTGVITKSSTLMQQNGYNIAFSQASPVVTKAVNAVCLNSKNSPLRPTGIIT